MERGNLVKKDQKKKKKDGVSPAPRWQKGIHHSNWEKEALDKGRDQLLNGQ